MIITALNAVIGDSKQSNIVFIPEGSHTITPSVNGKPQRVTVHVSAENGKKVAASLQADLEKRNTQNVRPIFDFDHNDTGPAAAIPQKFSYEPGKGIMVDVEWTGSGMSAIEAKDYSYFSPVFLLGKNGEPSGLPQRGPLGALVNDPAFRDIPRIAAMDASKQPTKNTMDDLVICGLLTEQEATKDNAERIARARVAELKENSDKVEALESKATDLEKENAELKKKIETSDKAIADAKKSKADEQVKAAVADGRLAPKDEANQKFWRDSILNNEQAVQALDALPKQHEGIKDKKVQASAGANQTNQSGDHALVVQARQLVKDGGAKTEGEAISLISARNPELYESYNDSLTNQ